MVTSSKTTPLLLFVVLVVVVVVAVYIYFWYHWTADAPEGVWDRSCNLKWQELKNNEITFAFALNKKIIKEERFTWTTTRTGKHCRDSNDNATDAEGKKSVRQIRRRIYFNRYFHPLVPYSPRKLERTKNSLFFLLFCCCCFCYYCCPRHQLLKIDSNFYKLSIKHNQRKVSTPVSFPSPTMLICCFS